MRAERLELLRQGVSMAYLTGGRDAGVEYRLLWILLPCAGQHPASLPKWGTLIQDGGAYPRRAEVARASCARRAGSRRARLVVATVVSFLPWSWLRGVA